MFPVRFSLSFRIQLEGIYSATFGIFTLAKARKAMWKPLQLALHKRRANQKQYCVLGQIEKVSDTTRYLKDVEMVIPAIFPFNLSPYLVQKTDGVREMTVDYNKFNQLVSPTVAAIPVVIFVVGVNIHTPWHLYMQIPIWQVLCSLKLHLQKQFSFKEHNQQYMVMVAVLSQSYINSTILVHNFIFRL